MISIEEFLYKVHVQGKGGRIRGESVGRVAVRASGRFNTDKRQSYSRCGNDIVASSSVLEGTIVDAP